MNFSLYLSLTGWLLAVMSFFSNPDETPNTTQTQENTAFECPDFICNNMVTVDLAGAPEDTVVRSGRTAGISILLLKAGTGSDLTELVASLPWIWPVTGCAEVYRI